MMRFVQPGYHVGGPGIHAHGWGVAGLVLMIILWVVVIAALVLGIRALVLWSRRGKTEQAFIAPPAGTDKPSPTVANAEALRILEERYARGDINREEFLQRRSDLASIL